MLVTVPYRTVFSENFCTFQQFQQAFSHFLIVLLAICGVLVRFVVTANWQLVFCSAASTNDAVNCKGEKVVNETEKFAVVCVFKQHQLTVVQGEYLTHAYSTLFWLNFKWKCDLNNFIKQTPRERNNCKQMVSCVLCQHWKNERVKCYQKEVFYGKVYGVDVSAVSKGKWSCTGRHWHFRFQSVSRCYCFNFLLSNPPQSTHYFFLVHYVSVQICFVLVVTSVCANYILISMPEEVVVVTRARGSQLTGDGCLL